MTIRQTLAAKIRSSLLPSSQPRRWSAQPPQREAARFRRYTSSLTVSFGAQARRAWQISANTSTGYGIHSSNSVYIDGVLTVLVKVPGILRRSRDAAIEHKFLAA